MIKNMIVAIAALGLAVSAAPAMANDFTGARVELTAGVDDVRNLRDTTDVTYGLTAGFDVGVTDNVIAGVEANVDNVFDRADIGASARLGYVATKNTLVYGKVGYANYKDAFSRNLDGLRVGAGLEHNISDNTYVGAEYRYTDFERGVGKHGALVKLGLRF